MSHELRERAHKNPAYSLRAFAKALNVSPAFVSQVFSGKRALSEERARDFAKKLKWPAKKKNLFVALVRYERTEDPLLKREAMTLIEDLSELDYMELKEDQFQLIAEGYHYTLVELVGLKGFRFDYRWIGRRLGIDAVQAEASVERLLRLGLLREENGRLYKSMAHHRIQDVPSTAIRAFHKDKLDQAVDALENQDFSSRTFLGSTVSISKKDLPKIQELTREFIDKLNKFCDKQEHPDAVYHMATQFFRLDREIK